MLQGGVTIYDSTGNFQWYVPYVYNGSSWVRAIPKVWNGSSWDVIGGAGTPMDYFIDKDGQYFMVGGDYFLVPREYNIYLQDSTSAQLQSSDGFKLAVTG